jgi:hypothetical protein
MKWPGANRPRAAEQITRDPDTDTEPAVVDMTGDFQLIGDLL